MATATTVSGGGARGHRLDWRARHRSSVGGADDDGNDGDEGDEGDARVVVRPARHCPPPPMRPPSDGDGNGSCGQWGWREGVLSRLAHAALELGLPHHRDGEDSENDGDVVM